MRDSLQRTIAAAFGLALLGCAGDSVLPPTVNPEIPITASASRAAVFPGGCCYYQGRIVRTVVPPAATPQEGRDNFYGFPGASATGQKGVVAVVPGDTDYHGGQWRFFAVTWNVTPYLLTSEAAVHAAAMMGHVTVTRVPANDFKCPIQP